MPRLINRQKQIPGGIRFYLPATKWQSRPWASFDQVVSTLIGHLQGNPVTAQKLGWSIDKTFIENQVDEFNAKLCQQMGWTDYYVADGGATPSVPFIAPTVQDQNRISVAAASLKRIWSGVRTLNDWLDSGDAAVSSELSTGRAAVCISCPKNGVGDFTTWFTKPASEAIRRQLERVKDRNLTTPHDELLNVCEACLCPLKLKVHTPMAYIKPHLGNDTVNLLRQTTWQKNGQTVPAPECWIIKELDV